MTRNGASIGARYEARRRSNWDRALLCRAREGAARHRHLLNERPSKEHGKNCCGTNVPCPRLKKGCVGEAKPPISIAKRSARKTTRQPLIGDIFLENCRFHHQMPVVLEHALYFHEEHAKRGIINMCSCDIAFCNFTALVNHTHLVQGRWRFVRKQPLHVPVDREGDGRACRHPALLC